MKLRISFLKSHVDLTSNKSLSKCAGNFNSVTLERELIFPEHPEYSLLSNLKIDSKYLRDFLNENSL